MNGEPGRYDGTPREHLKLRVGTQVRQGLAKIIAERYCGFETTEVPSIETYCKEVLENHIADWRGEKREQQGQASRHDDRNHVEELDL